MNRLQQLKIREKVELRIPSGEDISIFTVRVQGKSPEGIYLDRPLIDRRHFTSKEGDPIEVQFWRADAVYRFSSSIIEFTVIDGQPVILIQYPSELKRIQRRQHFRVDVLLQLTFSELIQDEEEESQEGEEQYNEPKKGLVENLSAGGVKFTATAADTLNLWRGSTIRFSMRLSNGEKIKDMAAQIVRIGPVPGQKTRTLLICRFIDPPENIREAIIVHNIRYQGRWRMERRE